MEKCYDTDTVVKSHSLRTAMLEGHFEEAHIYAAWKLPSLQLISTVGQEILAVETFSSITFNNKN